MKKLKLRVVTLFFVFILLFGGLSVGNLLENDGMVSKVSDSVNDDFYFVQITDTHVMHRVFDRGEASKKRFKTVLDEINSFEEKPAFVVITGDLTDWGENGFSGALNCLAFVSCLYKKNGQLYADSNFSIPVYTTPGNHDYCYSRNLRNYHRFIDKDDRYVVNYHDVSMFSMDSGPNHYLQPGGWFNTIDGDGLYNCDIDWLEDALSSCGSSHKIVLMHHPAVNIRDENGRMLDVIARNRERFVELCEEYDVDLVLAGHTHYSRIFDAAENFYYDNTSLNCSLYPTLFVQTDDCKEGIHYRNVSFVGDDVWLGNCVEVVSTSMNLSLFGTEARFAVESN